MCLCCLRCLYRCFPFAAAVSVVCSWTNKSFVGRGERLIVFWCSLENIKSTIIEKKMWSNINQWWLMGSCQSVCVNFSRCGSHHRNSWIQLWSSSLLSCDIYLEYMNDKWESFNFSFQHLFTHSPLLFLLNFLLRSKDINRKMQQIMWTFYA